MRGEARAGTQAHGPPQTHVPGTGAGEPEKHNKGSALKELGGWSGQRPAFWMLMHRRQSPLGSFWDCALIIDYFRAENHSHRGKLPGASDAKAEFSIRSGVKPVLGWTPGGSGRHSQASRKGASALLVSALPHLTQLSICRSQSQSQGDASSQPAPSSQTGRQCSSLEVRLIPCVASGSISDSVRAQGAAVLHLPGD